jgi:hypothetical protein
MMENNVENREKVSVEAIVEADTGAVVQFLKTYFYKVIKKTSDKVSFVLL